MQGAQIVSNIKVIAARKGIPLLRLYEDCQISSGAISQWKSGKTNPSTPKLSKIAHYLGVSLSELMAGVGQSDENEKSPAPTNKGGTEVNPHYFDLSEEDRAAVDAMIERLARAGR